MDTITLKSLYFHARHGFHEAERVEGNKFEVDVVFELSLETPGDTDELSHTIDYSMVYDTVQHVMNGPPVRLLETLATQIGLKLSAQFPQALSFTISVRKLNPPLSGPCAYSEITRKWQKLS